MGIPDMPDHIQKNFHDQIAASMDILLHVKSKLSSSNSLELKFKVCQNIKNYAI